MVRKAQALSKTSKLYNRKHKSAKPSKRTAKASIQDNLADAPEDPSLPLPTQQSVLDNFHRSFAELFQPAPAATSDAEDVQDGLVLTPLLQEMKAALFARDFAAAFEKARPELLDAYAARWSPTRALGYASVLLSLEEHLEEILVPADTTAQAVDGGDDNTETQTPDSRHSASVTSAKQELRMVAIGGGTAEVAALAAFLQTRNSQQQQQDEDADQVDSDASPELAGSLTLLDSAHWSSAITKLHANLTTPPPLSNYASASAKAANKPFLNPSDLETTFQKKDILSLPKQDLAALLSSENKQPILVTLLFTLNELYTTGGIGKTTAFLMNLTALVPEGSLLLVVDSPGSYSEAAVGRESKRYPMHWLLDHTLLKRPEQKRASSKEKEEAVSKNEEVGTCTWEKVDTKESVWFRLDDTLRYPIQLENMRYQMHLYRAVKSSPLEE